MTAVALIEPKSLSVSKTVNLLKADSSDFEWYPTPNHILEFIRTDMTTEFDFENHPSILDVGAGDGRALKVLSRVKDGVLDENNWHSKQYAIEKSQVHIASYAKEIVFVGSDFLEQSLIDKPCGVIYSNPPYSCFLQWAVKLITEANTNIIYLVLPKRWKESKEIADAIESRKGNATVINKFSFVNAERKARAKVDVVRITLIHASYIKFEMSRKDKMIEDKGLEGRMDVDPFSLWFDTHFKIAANKSDSKSIKQVAEAAIKHNFKDGKFPVDSGNYINALVKIYNQQLTALLHNYKQLENLDSELLGELNVNLDSVLEAIKLKIKGLKSVYWGELFSNLNKLTDNLTSAKREMMKDKFLSRVDDVNVDFSELNIHAVVIWVLKFANHYYDEQLVDLMTDFISMEYVTKYKSNHKVFIDEHYNYNRYNFMSKESHYKLEHRIICRRYGQSFLDDIFTVARNLNFNLSKNQHKSSEMDDRVNYDFTFVDNKTGSTEVLFKYKEFANGNSHIKFHPKFLLALNTEFGRIKGWLRTKEEAAEELNENVEDVAEFFATSLNINLSNINVNDILRLT